MRKALHTILLLAAAAVLWTGCGNERIPEPEPGQPGCAIDFSCGEVKSRVEETNDNNIASFRVSAVWTKAPGDYSPAFMNKQAVEKNGSGEWTYSPVRYMPTYGTVDFFAYSPADASVSEFGFAGQPYDQISLEYEVTTDREAQHDFMVAATIGQTTTPVPLDFNHMLSSIVRVEARNLDVMYACRVHKVELINLCRRGVLTGIADLNSKTIEWTWGGWSKPTTYTFSRNTPIDIPDVYEVVSDPATGPLMILPQTVTKGNKDDAVKASDILAGTYPDWMLGRPKDIDSKFYVVVTYELRDGMGNIVGEHIAAYFPLVDPYYPDQQFVFAKGTKYVFYIDLKHEGSTRSISAASSARLHIAIENE